MIIGNTLGIEISGKDLSFAVIRGVFRKIRLLHIDEVGGFVDLAAAEQKSCLMDLLRKQKISAGRVFLTLPRDRGIVRQVEFPAEVRDNLSSAVSLQIEAMCPWPLDEIHWAFSEQELKGAGKIIVTIVIIPRSHVEPWIDLFRSAKLPLSGVSLSTASRAHGVRMLWPASESTIILDCEPGYVDGLLVHSGHLSSIRQAGEDAAVTAKAAIDQLVSVGRIEVPKDVRLVLCGRDSESIEGVDPVRLPLENAPADASRRFGAIAAALHGVKKTAFHCNVVPPELRFRTNQLQFIPTYALLLITAALGIAMVLREPYQSTVYASKLEQEIKIVAPQARQVSAQAAELDRLALKYRALLANLQQKDYTLESLRELAATLPPTAWLTNYSYQDGTVTISGTATSASEIQKILEDTALLKDVQFTSSVARGPDGRERFSLKASIEVPR